MSKAGQRRHRPWRHEGTPGHAPSPQARQLAASPRMGALPAGVWHISDWAVGQLAGTTPVVSAATHQPSGARFLLASLPDGPIAGISPGDDVARRLLPAAWSDPTAWARSQRWRVASPDGSASTEGG